LGEVTAAAASATGLPVGTPVVAGGGDGQAGGLGCAVLGAGRAYLNLGTACVAGVYGERYATDPAWRTMISVSERGYIYELCLRTGTFLTDWLVKDLLEDDYARLEAEAAKLPIGSGGLLLQPYWSGCMTPYWDIDARGSIVGLSAEHGRAHLYRAKMEGIALDLSMGFAGMRAAGVAVDEIVAIGGGSRSDLWVRIIADATGTPVHRSSTIEASALGAGIAAAVGAGWFSNAGHGAAAMAGSVAEAAMPDPARSARYAELLGLYRQVYPALRDVMAGLAAFKATT
jgi:xylulokinase